MDTFQTPKNNVNTQKGGITSTIVHFTDVKMTSPAGKRSNGGFVSRRKKCIVVSLFVSIAFFLLLINAGLFSSTGSYTGELCHLEDIPLQRSFDRKKFAGAWFGSMTKGLDNKLLASLLDFYDVKMNFVYKDEKEYGVKSGMCE